MTFPATDVYAIIDSELTLFTTTAQLLKAIEWAGGDPNIIDAIWIYKNGNWLSTTRSGEVIVGSVDIVPGDLLYKDGG